MMKADTIAVVPEYGYNPTNKPSIKCQQRLRGVSEEQKIRIQHAFNGGEYHVEKYLLDGICHENKTIYEFHGCVFHGCPKCFQPATFNVLKQQTMAFVYKRHCERIKAIKELMPRYRLVEMWECEFSKSHTEKRVPLTPRDALFGGKTNAIKLHHKCTPDEKIKYMDLS